MNIVRKITIYFSLLFISINGLTGQDCADGMNNLTWDFQIVNSGGGPLEPCSEFFIECYVTGFVDIIAFQYTLSFNPNVLEFVSVDNLGSELVGPVVVNPDQVTTGSIPTIWTNGNGEAQTIDDGPIFKIFLKVIGDPEECSDWFISENIVEYEVAFDYPDGSSCTESFEDAIQQLSGGPLCIDCGNDVSLISNACGGDLELSSCGGTGPYTYTLEGPGGIFSGTIAEGDVETFSDLEAGLYLVTLMDSSSPPQSLPSSQGTIDIENSAPLAVQIDIDPVQNIPCGTGDGLLTASALGGVQDYTFEWSNGLFSDMAEVPSGEYTVTVTDANGCTAESDPVSIGIQPMTVTSLQITGATCLGSEDGSVTITIEGGTPIGGTDYSFAGMTGPIVFLDNLNPGMFEVNITDERGCLLQVDVQIPAEGTGMFDIINEVPIECFGDFAQLNIAGDFIQPAPGFFPEIVNLDSSPFNPLIAGPNPSTGNLDFLSQGPNGNEQGLAPGDYIITFYTVDGCEVELNYVVPGAPEIIIDVMTEESPDCDGNPGHITVTIDGGVPPLTPTWNMGGPGLDFDVTVGGTYTLIVTDDNMCSDSVSIQIADPGSLGLMTMVTNEVGCGAAADSGAAEATITGGGSNITYSWLNSSGDEIGDEATIDGLTVGTYTVIVTDEDMDCSQEGDVIIGGAGTFFFNPDITPLNCANGSDAAIEMDVNGGIGPFTYEWSHDPTLQFNLASNLTSGSYTVTITDADQCALDTTIVIDSPEQMFLDLIDSEAVSCFDGMDGTATISTTDNANGATTFTYFWELAETNTTVEQFTGEFGEATGLPPGEIIVYSVANNCFSDTISFVIPNAPEIQVDSMNSTFQNPPCAGLDEGMILLTAMGGTSTGNYGFEWDTGDSGNTISDLAEGEYIVSITDDNACVVIDTFELIEPDLFELGIDSFLTTTLSCFGDSLAMIGTFTSGGTGSAITYDWMPQVSTTSSADSLTVGDYTIIATDEAGCTATLVHQILSAEPLTIENIAFDPIPCNSGMTEVCLEVSGGTGFGYNYQVNFSDNIPIDSCFSTAAGEFDFSVTDSEGCPYIGEIVFDIPQPDPIELDLSNGVDLEIGEGLTLELGDTSFVIDPTITSPNNIINYFWSSESNDWECFDPTDPDCVSITVFPTAPTIYSLEVVDENGCTANADILVEVTKPRRFYTPNVFTPNGDGEAEIIHPFTGKGVTRINEWKIYDRWGNEVHSAEDIEPGSEILSAWDGRFQGTEALPGVYVYIAEVEFIDDEILFFKGSITLLR